MEYLLLTGFGGMFPIWLIGALIAKFALKKLDIKPKILLSTLIAYVLALIISGFGASDDSGGFRPMYVEYFLSSILAIVMRLGIATAKKT